MHLFSIPVLFLLYIFLLFFLQIIPIIKPVLLLHLLFKVVTVVISSEISLYKKPNGILSKFCPSETSKYIDNFSILDFIICSLLFIALTKEEKDDILDMDFTYENWKDKSFVLINNFIKRVKNSSPDSI